MILQSGSITPGHIPVWLTDNVLGDGGVFPTNNILTRLLGADFNVTTDQAIALPLRVTAIQLTGILITNASISLTTAVGGFYPTISKGGTPLVAASQVYSTLTTAAKLLSATLAAAVPTTRYSSTQLDVIDGLLTIYLSLTTAQGADATADIYLLGNNLSV